jgi:hypothetical protein
MRLMRCGALKMLRVCGVESVVLWMRRKVGKWAEEGFKYGARAVAACE